MSESVFPEKTCQRCGLPSEADFCDPCFQEQLLDELDGCEVDLFTGLPLPRGIESPEEIVVWSELAGIDRLVDFAAAFLTDKELEGWREKLLPLLCAYGDLDEVGGQVDLINTFDELFSAAVERFIVAYGVDVSWLRAKRQQNFVKLNLLVGKLQELSDVGVKAEAAEARRLERQQCELGRRAAARAEVPMRDVGRLILPQGLDAFFADSDFQSLAAISQKVFCFAWGQAAARVGGKGFWCKLGVAGCAKIFGTSARTVGRARRQLKDGGWLRYVTQVKKRGGLFIARGSKKSGVARFYVAQSPKDHRKSKS